LGSPTLKVTTSSVLRLSNAANQYTTGEFEMQYPIVSIDVHANDEKRRSRSSANPSIGAAKKNGALRPPFGKSWTE
jgi:hypothetical protein